MNKSILSSVLLMAIMIFSRSSLAENVSATFFVATDGNDAWSGMLPQPNSQETDGPFATLHRARNAVRELKQKQGLTKAVTVMVRGGKYYLQEPLLLRAVDSGTRDFPITYTAYPGEKPIISSGRRITGWKPYKGKVLRCELPRANAGRWKFRQLFFNGKRQTRARWPNFEPHNPIYGGWLIADGPAEEYSTTAFKYKPGTFPRRWAKPMEVEVVHFKGPWHSRVPIKAIDEHNRIITLMHGGWQFDVLPWHQPVTFKFTTRFYVENALEELDQPGEWCFDSQQAALYFWPPINSIQDAEVVVPLLDCLIAIQGFSWINSASWITISGFTFTETADGDNFLREGAQGGGAMYPRPGWKYCGQALLLKHAEFCVIENNHFDAVGGNAVYLEGDCIRNSVRHNEIGYAGSNSICLVGSREKHPRFNHISDNYLHHGGVFNKYTAGIFSGMSDGNIISHNRIEHMPHHAINLGNSPHGRNIVEYNRIRFADQEIADSGAINCWMEVPANRESERCGHVIRFNYIADTYSCQILDSKVVSGSNMVSGLYLDNLASNCFVYGNIIVRSGNAIVVHGGKNNLIENNIIVDCLSNVMFQGYICGSGYWRDTTGFMTGNHVRHNVFYQSDPGAYALSLRASDDRTVAESDRNVYFQKGEEQYIFEGGISGGEPDKRFTLATWQKLGYDAHSVIADPMFVDPENDDYRLRPESPALMLGFQSIDVSKIGPRR